MGKQLLKGKKINYMALGFFIPFTGMLLIMILSGFTPFGTSSMLYSDCYHQYFPFFKAFCNALRSGDSLLYCWDTGMGMDYLGLIAYYLASPLNLLGVLIPDSLLLPYFSLLTPVRLGFAGLFFALFLKKVFNKDHISISIFGSFYALSAWAMGYMWNVMWLDTFALLPLVMLGMYSLMTERKFILYTTTLFLSVLSNYYIGFFTCIFVLISFICYEICRWQGFKKLFFDFIWIAAFSLIAIALSAFLELSAFAALQTTQSSVNKFPETFAMNIADRNLYANVNADWAMAKEAMAQKNWQEVFSYGWSAIWSAFRAILNGMRQCAGNMFGGVEPTFKEGLPNLYCGIGTIIFAFLFLTCKQIKLRDKLCTTGLLLFFILSFLLRQLDYIWHGFHFTNMIPYRFSFLFCFVMLYMAYRAFLHRNDFKQWQLIIAAILTLALAFCSPALADMFDQLQGDKLSNELQQILSNWSWTENDFTKLGDHLSNYAYAVYNGIFIVVYVAILAFLFFQKKSPENPEKLPNKNANSLASAQNTTQIHHGRIRAASTILTVIFCIELIMNLVNFTVNFGGTAITHYPRGKEDAEKIYSIMHQREKNTLFYRAEASHSQTLNDGALNGYNGISTFTSSANVKVTEFMKDLGYGAKNTYNRYCFEESSPIANLFLGLKYMIERNGNTAPNSYFDVISSSGNVYLLENNAYLPLGFLANKELAELDFASSNDDFDFQSRLLSAASGIEKNPWHYLLGNELEIDSSDVAITSSRDDGYSAYTASAAGTIVYTYKPLNKGLFCIDLTQSKRNNFAVYHNGKKLYSETYSLPQMLSVCNVEPGDTIEVKFTCKSGESGTIDLVAAILDETVFRNTYSILHESTLQLTKFTNTKIQGTIQCNRDGILYTSIPQNADNWRVKVDGKPTEITLIGDCMVGVMLTEGEHQITFTYVNKVFNTGLCISIAALVIFVGLWILFYKPKFHLPFKKIKKGKFQK